MSINIDSEDYCRKAYLNYHLYKNTMGLTSGEMGQICNKYSSEQRQAWINTATDDVNDYVIDDTKFENAKTAGKDAAKEKTGFDGDTNTGVKIAKNGSSIIMAGATALDGGVKALKNIPNITKSGSLNGVEKMSKKAKVGAYAEAIAAIAVAACYMIAKPNKEAVNAAKQMQETFTNETMGNLDAQAEVLCDTEDKIQESSDLATEANEQAQENIEEKKAEYDLYMESYMTILDKINKNEPLTDSEKALFEDLVKYLSTIGVDIDTIAEDTGDEVEDLYSDLEGFQADYDSVATEMANALGQTEFAASFDSTTKDLCVLEGVGQACNAVTGAMAGGKLLVRGWLDWVAAAVGAASIAAGIKSGFASVEQFKFADDVNAEIGVRKATEDLNTDLGDLYEEGLTYYEGSMTGVEDLELEMPDEVDAPEVTSLPPETDGQEGSTAFGFATNDNNQDNAGGANNSSSSTNPFTGSPTDSSNSNTTGEASSNNTGTTSGANSAVTHTPSGNSTGYANMTDILSGKVESASVVKVDGKVGLSTQYATAITKALGLPASTSGQAFDQAMIPNIISQLLPGFDTETIKKVMNGEQIENTFDATIRETLDDASMDPNRSDDHIHTEGTSVEVDNTQKYTQKVKTLINFYQPILTQAAMFGWKVAG